MSHPILIYWAKCPGCGYETAVHGRVNCPDCDVGLRKLATAGAVLDKPGETQ